MKSNISYWLCSVLHLFMIGAIHFTIASENNTVTVDLDVTDGTMGNKEHVIYLGKKNISRVVATENVANRFNGVTFTSLKDLRFQCTHMCFTSLSKACDPEVELDIIIYSNDNKQDVKIYSCRELEDEEWCVETSKLRVMAVLHRKSSPNPAENKKPYQFQADVKLRCGIVNDPYNRAGWQLDDEKKQYRAKVEGIVVGCCLALIFLVVLFIMYCYYTSKPTDGSPEDGVIKVKVSAFTGIKEKLNIKKKKKVRSRPPSRRPSQMSTRSAMSATYEAARRMSAEPRTELKPPEMVISNHCDTTDCASTSSAAATEAETKPLCENVA